MQMRRSNCIEPYLYRSINLPFDPLLYQQTSLRVFRRSTHGSISQSSKSCPCTNRPPRSNTAHHSSPPYGVPTTHAMQLNASTSCKSFMVRVNACKYNAAGGVDRYVYRSTNRSFAPRLCQRMCLRVFRRSTHRFRYLPQTS